MTVKACLETWARIECAGRQQPIMVREYTGQSSRVDFELVLHTFVQTYIFSTGRLDGVFVAKLLYGLPARWDQRPIKSKLQSLMELGHGELVLTPSSIIHKQIVKDFLRCFEEWVKKNPIPEYIEPRSEDYIPDMEAAQNWGGWRG